MKLTLLKNTIVVILCLVSLSLQDYSGKAYASQSDTLKIIFLGTTTLVFTDENHTFVLDGFVSRPTVEELIFRKKHSSRVADIFVDQLGIKTIDLITVLHTHYDHALDIPEIIKEYEPKLIGSQSLRNLVCCADESCDCHQLEMVKSENMGRFNISLEKSIHSAPPNDFWMKTAQRFAAPLGGKITSSKIPRTGLNWARNWYEGQSNNIAVKHADKLFYVYGGKPVSEEGLLRNADVVFLSVPAYPLKSKSVNEHEEFWAIMNNDASTRRDLVRPKVIIPIHWDNLTEPIGKKVLNQKLPCPNHMGKSIILALSFLKGDVDLQNNLHDEKRFILYVPETYGENLNISFNQVVNQQHHCF